VNFDGKPFHLTGGASAKLSGSSTPSTSASTVPCRTPGHRRDLLADSTIGVSSLFREVLTLKATQASVSPRAGTADLPALRLAFANYQIDGALAANWSNPNEMKAAGTVAFKDVNSLELLQLLAVEPPRASIRTPSRAFH